MRIAFVGWRGMVGSVLLDRMRAEGDFRRLRPVFFSTSQAQGAPPDVGPTAAPVGPIQHAHDVVALSQCEIIVSCQGSAWTDQLHPALRAAGYRGHFIDASSALRMRPEARIMLDPLNGRDLIAAREAGVRDWIGGNCTTSLMLLALAGLVEEGLIEWVSAMSYQAASGAGAAQMRELIAQMGAIYQASGDLPHALTQAEAVQRALEDPALPTEALGAPLAANLLPYIDRPVADGRSREEAKTHEESTRILGERAPQVDGTCVRVGSLRSHALGLTVKLREAMPLEAVEEKLRAAHPWLRLVPNTREASLHQLSPAAVSGRLDIAVGRVRPMRFGPEYFNLFTVGDQLLWGAAEPLRRTLQWLAHGERPEGWQR